MPTKSYLPKGGANLFQEVKEMCNKREADGNKIWRLTIGQPKGPALPVARQYCSEAVLSDLESMHEYQDNGSPGIPGFAKEFVNLHLASHLEKYEKSEQIKYLPIPGIKPMLGVVILAMGSYLPHYSGEITVATMTDPGYPTPAVQCDYLKVLNYPIPTNPQNRFLFSLYDLPSTIKLIMTNYPHNPSGQIATINFWIELCDYCAINNISLFNDAAYAMLAHNKASCSLAEVAVDFPGLRWAEAYSASKVIANGTGWRVGAIVGSTDFVDDIATIKGNCDSGFFAPAALGVLRCMQKDMESIINNRKVFGDRIKLLTNLLRTFNMKLAVIPGAGFFTLWQVPRIAFGQKVNGAKEFNDLMVDKTGVAGVHFGPYIRYAVTQPIEHPDYKKAISDAFEMADVKY